jgi:hypothetical protein
MTSHDPELAILELRDSVAWAAGVGHERRRISELLRHRASTLQLIPGIASRSVQAELRRLADLIETAG